MTTNLAPAYPRDSIRPVSSVRILLDYRPALRQRTGVGEYVHELARALAHTAPAGESLLLFSASWKDRLRESPVPGLAVVDRRIPVRMLNFAWHRLGWPPAEVFAGSGLDVAFSGHPLLMPARRAARVVTAHDLDFLDHPERTSREIRRDYAPLAAQHARRADHVIAVSRFTAGEVERRLGVPANRISVCPPGRPDWVPRPAEPAEARVLFLGTLEPRKNLGTLVEAFARLVARGETTARLVLAGRPTDEAAPLLARLADPPLAGRVDLPGYIDPDTREALYRQATVVVLPSHLEGFGLPALEAMTCGVPVIVANRGALPEVVGEAGRLIDPDDPEGLTVALAEVLADEPLRARMRERGLRQAARYDWTHTAAAVREAWGRAVARRGARRD